MAQLHTYDIRGIAVAVYDEIESESADRVAGELEQDAYGLERIPFEPGDVVIDVGAHVGLVSIFLAKRWPFLQIRAFEPHPVNHRHCADNLRLNGVANVVQLSHLAVTVDRRDVVLRSLPSNSGGATAVYEMEEARCSEAVASVTLTDIFETALAPAQRCRLLKIDCEGIEHEILPSPLLERVDFLSGEFHELANESPHRALGLMEQCAQYVGWDRLRVTRCLKQD